MSNYESSEIKWDANIMGAIILNVINNKWSHTWLCLDIVQGFNFYWSFVM